MTNVGAAHQAKDAPNAHARHSESGPPAKRNKIRRDDDSLSVCASDEDVNNLLNGANGRDDATHCGADKSAEVDEGLLKELEAALTDEAQKGPTINQQLADVVNKRWCVKLNQEKLRIIL